MFKKKTVFDFSTLIELSNCGTPELERSMAHHVTECHAEIDRLTALVESPPSREWIAIESADQLSQLPDGTYEFVNIKRGISVRMREDGAFDWSDAGIKSGNSHYRLITLLSDFTPPGRKYKLGDSEYSLSEMPDELKAEILAIAQAVGE